MNRKQDKLSNYTTIKKLGEGSYGEALLVRNKLTNMNFVIKKIKIAEMQASEIDDSLKETRILSSLNNPNIIHYHDCFYDKQNIYIVMEYAD